MRTLREALKLLWDVADGYARRRLLLTLALVALGASLMGAIPVVLKLIVDSLSASDAVAASRSAVTLVVIFVLGQYLWRCSGELRTLLQAYAEQRLNRRIGRRIFEHLIRLPLQFHLQRKVGTVGEVVAQGLKGYQLLIYHAVYTLLPVVIEMGMIAAVLLHFGYPVYLLVIAISAFAYAVAFRHGAYAVGASASLAANAHVEAQGVLTDSLVNQETVKYFDAEPIVCCRYDAALGSIELAWRGFFRRRATNGVLVATIFAVSLGFSLAYAVRQVAAGTMTVGDFVLVNAYVARLVQPLEMLGYALRDVAQSLAFLRNLLGLFGETAEPGGKMVSRSARSGELVFQNVSFSYRHERAVLSGVTFAIPAGRTVAVVGVSGSGKSSLIRLLFRLYEPDGGRILLDGVPIAEMDLSTVRRAIAVVPQDTVLFHDTIGQNIGFGRVGATRQEIEEAARLANLHDFISLLPDGYETMVGERGLKLSGGERQRVAIARAALKRPHLFVFDEATSSLDSRTEHEILQNLNAISSRGTTLVIAHRLSTIAHVDEILVLDQGVVVERGTHGELLARGGHYAALWNAQYASAAVQEAAADEIH